MIDNSFSGRDKTLDTNSDSKVTAVVGLQYGDEGKGQAIHELASEDYDVVMRYQGGANAGHTVYNEEGEKLIFHLIPSGLFSDSELVLGKDMVMDPFRFAEELENIEENTSYSMEELKDKIGVSERLHITLPEYYIDELEGIAQGKIGSTLMGVGPTATRKAERSGKTVIQGLYDYNKGTIMDGVKNSLEKIKEENLYSILNDKWNLDSDMDFTEFSENYLKKFERGLELLKDMRIDLINYDGSNNYYNSKKKEGKNIIIEGAQGALLSYKDGSYPFVTSTDPTVNGIPSGTEIPLDAINKIIGVFKGYITRVGGGPFYTQISRHPTEGDVDPEELESIIVDKGGEYGATTGRPRKCGDLDLVALKQAININKPENTDFELRMVKADVLGGLPEINVAEGYRYIGEDEDMKNLLLSEPSGVEKSSEIVLKKFPSIAIPEDDIEPLLTSISEIEGIDGPWEDADWDAVGTGEKNPPRELELFIEYIEEKVGEKISQVSIGPEGYQTYER